MLAGIDRQSFAVLLVPIQKDLRVGDAAMGALTGTAFAIVYSLVSLPVARLADRTNRRNLLAAAVAIWSLATGLLGFVGGYLGLLLVRVAVAGAESAQLPTTLSLVSDSFPPARRGASISFIVVGTALGYSLGSALAGFLNDRFNWHVALMLVGFPGLLVAALVYLTVREPARGAHDGGGVTAPPASLLVALGQCARIRTLWFVAPGTVFLYAAFGGWLVWVPAFLMRVDHLSSTRMGAVFGLIIAGSTLSNPITGHFSDRLARRGPRWRLYLCAGLTAAAVPWLVASTLVPDLAVTFGLLLIYNLISGGITTASQAAYVSVAPANLRATVAAVLNSLATVLGSIGGPLFFGLVNDQLKQVYGDQSLRYTLLLVPLMMIIAALLHYFASFSMDRDVKTALRD
jgi:predicted MFS family arabinose efflux permease